jgi:hypothetical protein
MSGSDAWSLLASNPSKRMTALHADTLQGKTVLVRLDLNTPLRLNAAGALEVYALYRTDARGRESSHPPLRACGTLRSTSPGNRHRLGQG